MSNKLITICLLVSIILVLTASSLAASNITQVSNNAFLAKVSNQENLTYDRTYAKQYLELRQNFSNLKFQRVWNDKEEFQLSVGNKVNTLKGIRTNKGRFALDLVFCNEFEKSCKFRINGVPTSKMFANSSFDLDGEFVLKINSAKFNQCDNHRFCNYWFEGYDIINVSVERK